MSVLTSVVRRRGAQCATGDQAAQRGSSRVQGRTLSTVLARMSTVHPQVERDALQYLEEQQVILPQRTAHQTESHHAAS